MLYTCVYNVYSTVDSTANEKEEWLESLHNAIKVYARKQTSFGSVRSHKSNVSTLVTI